MTSKLHLVLPVDFRMVDCPVAELKDDVASGTDGRIVRRDKDGLFEAMCQGDEQVGQDHRVLAIQVARRLVGENQHGVVHEGERRRYPLLLAAA